MKENSIEQWNDLIARFLEMDNYKPEEIYFHNTWNLLMMAVEKINSMGYELSISSYQTQIYEKRTRRFMIDADFHDDRLRNTYEAVLSFIEIISEEKSAEARKLNSPIEPITNETTI